MDTGTVIGNETRIFVARNFAVFQNRARWSIFGGFVMRPTDVCQRRSAMGIVRAVQESRFFSCANPGFVLVSWPHINGNSCLFSSPGFC